MSKGGAVAYVILFLWPLISIRFYKTKSIQVGTLWTLIGGFMFLPVGTFIDLPFIPMLDKNTIPVLSALFGCWFIKKRKFSYFGNKGFLKVLVALVFVGPFLTVELNGDSFVVGEKFLRGLTHHDALSVVINQLLFITPFFIGRLYFRTYQNQLLLFKFLLVAGLIYSVLILFEIRMSPRLHSWIYDYFPHSFAQHKRSGGFRPVVFMGHGLWVAFFSVMVFVSSVILWKNKEKVTKFSPALLSYYLLLVLVLCKSLASLMYGIFAFLVIKITSPKTQLRIAVIFVSLALLYPTMSILKIFPHHKIVEIATSIDESRAHSLLFRFDNEELLLDHGRKKFFFGWGGWGRNRVYNEITGKDKTVTDGRWIIIFGQFGWIGFMAEFGLLAIAVFRANNASKLIKSKKELNLLSVHALLVGLIMIDQLPNASLAPWLWLLTGILLGRAEDITAQYKVSRLSI